MKHSTLTQKILTAKKQGILVFFLFALCFSSPLSAQITLYGMTEYGGTDDSGTVFKCTTAGVITTLVNNLDKANGAIPFQCGLVMATDGNLYGMTAGGGSNNDGVIYRCTTTGTITPLVSFTGAANGESPRGNLIQAKDGNLYGVTYGGGKYNDGIIFKCSLAGVLDTLASFNEAVTGQFPRGTLLQATDGNLYGMTQSGGSSNDGVLFKCTTAGVLTALVNFNGANGTSTFYGTLIQATDSNLYGTTSNGGTNNDGTLFQCTLTGTLTTLVSFNGAGNGSGIEGNIVEASDGNIYGVTSSGGSSNEGTLFQYTLSNMSPALNTLVNFAGANGSAPSGGLVLGSDGYLYGVTQTGGSNGDGTLFQYTLGSGTPALNTLVSFAGANGSDPSGSLLAVSVATGVNNINISKSINIYPNPNDGHFMIAGLTNGMIIETYDYTGRMLSSIWVNNATMQLNLAGYPNGIYLVRVLSNNGNLVDQKKIIKMQ